MESARAKAAEVLKEALASAKASETAAVEAARAEAAEALAAAVAQVKVEADAHEYEERGNA